MSAMDCSLDSVIDLKRFDEKTVELLKSLKEDYAKEKRDVRASIFFDCNNSNMEFENQLIAAQASERTLEIIEVLSSFRRMSSREAFRATPDRHEKICLVLYEA